MTCEDPFPVVIVEGIEDDSLTGVWCVCVRVRVRGGVWLVVVK